MLGIEHGLYDAKDWKSAGQCDQVAESCNDFLGGLHGAKGAKMTALIEKTLRPFLLMVEGMLVANGSTKNVVGNKLTTADVCMWTTLHNSLMNPKYKGSALAMEELNSGKYPNLLKYAESLEAEFADYAASRPQKSF